MAYNLEISARAQEDIIRATDYYDGINPALATRFLDELYKSLEQLKHNPQFYSLISSKQEDKFRDVKLKYFPYVIVFEIYIPVVVVTAIMNTHQKPFLL